MSCSETPVIAIAVQDHTYSKLITNIEEISARSAPVISVVQNGDNNAAKVSNYHHGDYEKNTYTGGYYNTTSDVDAIKFFMSSGNIDSGTIKLYGIKDS